MSLSFGGVRAIDGVDLEIRTGEVHGLIGPNGSGKTTTLNVISGYYAPQQGRVQLNGSGAAGRGPRIRAPRYRIARTFQTPRLVGEASVLENVMIGGTMDGRGTLRRVAAGAAPPSPRRSAPARGGDGGAGRGRAWISSPTCAPTGCSTASCASSRSRAR